MAEPGAISGVDHLLIGVRDLTAAQAVWQRLGFTLTPRGRHIQWGTGNYCIMFPNDYLELLGIVDRSRFVNNLDRFLETREGLMGLAFATDDAERAVRRLIQAGYAAEGPKDLQRILELPEGEARPAFRLVTLPASATPGLSAFICSHLTPDLVRRPAWLAHPNGAQAISSVTVVVDDPSALALPYGALFGFDRVTVADGQVTLDSGGPVIRFVAARHLLRLQPGAEVLPDYPCPWLIAFRLRVANVAVTADVLDARGVRFKFDRTEVIRVPAAEANGVILEFAEG